MISQIKGTVTHIDLKFLVVNTGTSNSGIGYKVFVPADTLAQYTVDSPASFWTHLAVRETAMDLYGFPTLGELDFFELLITVSGIGPKTAIGILNVASVHTLRSAIESGDTSPLTKVAGIGKKNAEKIVLELRDKVADLPRFDTAGVPQSSAHVSSDMDAIEALKSLGFSAEEARDALKKIDKTISGTGAKVKAALKMLG